MLPNKEKGIQFADYQQEDRLNAADRLAKRRLSAQERHNLEAQRTQEYSNNKSAAEKYQTKPEALPRTMQEWNDLRRKDRHTYNRLANQLVRDRQILGDAFYDTSGRTGAELLAGRLNEATEDVPAAKGIFDQ